MSPSDAVGRPASGSCAPSRDPGADPPYRALSDRQVLVMAAGAWLAARTAWPPVPLVVALAAMAFGLVRRWPWLVLVAVVLVASARGAGAVQAWRPVEPAAFAGSVSLVADPEPAGLAWQAAVRLADGRRVQAGGYGAAGAALAGAASGDRVDVTGRLRPVAPGPWALSRHLVGRLDLDRVTGRSPPGGPRRVVEAARSLVVRGAAPLAERQRPLYLGLIIGDDRAQSPAQRARFRAAGLSHLLAVSGQNVAFLLAAARPLTSRLGPRGRFAAVLALLAGFAVATRLEPSVLRATATAGLAAWAALGGHPQGGLRLLGLAVTGLVLIDPFLVHAVGFQLSVAASVGILALSPRLSRHLPGPAMLAEPLAVTLGAQVAVLPLQLHSFGPVSAAAVPANLLAGWPAGVVMTWGLSVGVVAGLLPRPLGQVVQWPMAVAVTWLDRVAAWAPRLPMPLIGSRLAVGAAAFWLVWRVARRRWPPRRARWLTAVGGVAWLVASIVAVPTPPPEARLVSPAALWWPSGSGPSRRPSALVVGTTADDRVLEALLRWRVTSIDVVVACSGGRSSAQLVAWLRELLPVGTVVAPARHRIPGARTVADPISLATGGGSFVIEPAGGRLRVASGTDPPAGCGG